MIEETKNTFNLNMHTARLLMNEPFFASLSRRVNKISSTAIPTAGVRVNPETSQFEMIYNPNFFATLDDIHKAGVLKHEFYHLIFEHVIGRRPEGENAMLWNFATDLAINSHLEGELPDTCLMPGEREFADYTKGLSAEAYLKQIKKDEQFQKSKKESGEKEKEKEENDESGSESSSGSESGNGPGDGQFDSHEDWGKADSTANEIAKERLKDYIKKAVEETSHSGNGWGSVPSNVRKDIMAQLQTFIDWRKVLRYFIKTSQRAAKRSTIRKINNRFPYIHPGKKVKRQAKIAISIDQSGSVSDSMLEAFFGELSKLSKHATFTVIPFDTRVEESLIYEWKKGENRKVERVMHGGTCFDAPTAYVNKNGFDGHILLTDMYAAKPKSSKCQRMWMTTKSCAARPYFNTHERIIAIDEVN